LKKSVGDRHEPGRTTPNSSGVQFATAQENF
jgi:hypothetical protein